MVNVRGCSQGVVSASSDISEVALAPMLSPARPSIPAMVWGSADPEVFLKDKQNKKITKHKSKGVLEWLGKKDPRAGSSRIRSKRWRPPRLPRAEALQGAERHLTNGTVGLGFST